MAVTKRYAAILFDMDGTLIDSTNAVTAHWKRFGEENSIDPLLILASSHGRRTIDIIKLWAPDKANWEYVTEVEGEIPMRNAEDAKELPGARSIIEALDKFGSKWAIVTSGTKVLAGSWMEIMKLPAPKVFVTADHVEKGKPDPQGYLMARKLLNVPMGVSVLVVEDAPAGIRAGKAAGCEVLGLLTTHTREQLLDSGADYIQKDLSGLQLIRADEKWIEVAFAENAAVIKN